ncbi:MAG: exo-beta-N-acetylmuramidase NamZ domain-containing protein [Acidobacteriota bacterium]
MSSRRSVVPGLEILLQRAEALLGGRRIGLLANPASVDRRLVHAADRLRALPGVELAALFGPEHGLRGGAQDMEAVESRTDSATGLPVYSLYGERAASLSPTQAMLRELDLLVCDLPDVGARYYTYSATVLHVLREAASVGLPVLVTDRPNPLGGEVVEGPGLDPGFESFVGCAPIPVRHGLTMGELALFFKQTLVPEVDLEVIPMRGWCRSFLWEDTGLAWVPPSPNMPTTETAFVYPGACLVEGTNLSEGRGTTRPFEWVGAPWVDAHALASELNALGRPGVRFRAHWFRPLAQKWQGATCGGVQVHVTRREYFRAFPAYVALLAAVRRQDPARFAWRTDPYEFEDGRLAIDLLSGSGRLRRDLEAARPLAAMEEEWRREAEAFLEARRPSVLYPQDG